MDWPPGHNAHMWYNIINFHSPRGTRVGFVRWVPLRFILVWIYISKTLWCVLYAYYGPARTYTGVCLPTRESLCYWFSLKNKIHIYAYTYTRSGRHHTHTAAGSIHTSWGVSCHSGGMPCKSLNEHGRVYEEEKRAPRARGSTSWIKQRRGNLCVFVLSAKWSFQVFDTLDFARAINKLGLTFGVALFQNYILIRSVKVSY